MHTFATGGVLSGARLASLAPHTAPRRSAAAGRSPTRVVAMAGRKKRKDKSRKAKQDKEGGSSPAAPASAPVETPAAGQAPVAAPAPPPARRARDNEVDWGEIERNNESARSAAGGSQSAPAPAGDGLLEKAFSADAQLLFAVDGCVPEVVNGRVAMFGFFTAMLNELITGKSFTTQLAFNLTHGVSLTIITLVIAGTLAPMIMADPKETPFQGTGLARWRPEPLAKAGRQYLCDPRAVDCTGLPGKDTPLGRIGFGPTAETWNGRAAMVGLILTFVIEGATHHGIFRG